MPVEWLATQNYDNKEDVVNAVINYHRLSHREFTVYKSDKERYYVKCKVAQCKLMAHFLFRDGHFGPPRRLVKHTCDIVGTNKTTRHTSTKFLAQLPEVVEMLRRKGREMTMVDMQACVLDADITAGYLRAKELFFKKDAT